MLRSRVVKRPAGLATLGIPDPGPTILVDSNSTRTESVGDIPSDPKEPGKAAKLARRAYVRSRYKAVGTGPSADPRKPSPSPPFPETSHVRSHSIPIR